MKILVIAIAVVVMCTVVSCGWILGKLIFVSNISTSKVKRMEPIDFLRDDYKASPLEIAQPINAKSFTAADNHAIASREAILTSAGVISSDVFDADLTVDRHISILDAQGPSPAKLFLSSHIYGVDGDRIGSYIHAHEEIHVSTIRHIASLNDDWFLMASSPYSSAEELWQISHHDYSHLLLTDTPYYTSEPPHLFKPDGFSGMILVYYSGIVTFGYGGDSSRPHFSTIRLFNAEHPVGIDIARLSLNAGKVVDIKIEGDAIIAYCDPNLPNSETDLPLNVWKIERDGGNLLFNNADNVE